MPQVKRLKSENRIGQWHPVRHTRVQPVRVSSCSLWYNWIRPGDSDMKDSKLRRFLRDALGASVVLRGSWALHFCSLGLADSALLKSVC